LQETATGEGFQKSQATPTLALRPFLVDGRKR